MPSTPMQVLDAERRHPGVPLDELVVGARRVEPPPEEQRRGERDAATRRARASRTSGSRSGRSPRPPASSTSSAPARGRKTISDSMSQNVRARARAVAPRQVLTPQIIQDHDTPRNSEAA